MSGWISREFALVSLLLAFPAGAQGQDLGHSQTPAGPPGLAAFTPTTQTTSFTTPDGFTHWRK